MIKCNTKYYDSFYRKNIRYYLISETDNSLWALTVAVFDYVSILTKISMLFNNNYNINGFFINFKCYQLQAVHVIKTQQII